MTDISTRLGLTRKEAADHLSRTAFPISANTLARYAVDEVGPPFVIVGSRAIYTREQLDVWASEKMRSK